MNENWYIFKGDHHLGPFNLEEIKNMFTVGKLSGEDLVWREGDEHWKSLMQVPELEFLFNPDVAETSKTSDFLFGESEVSAEVASLGNEISPESVEEQKVLVEVEEVDEELVDELPPLPPMTPMDELEEFSPQAAPIPPSEPELEINEEEQQQEDQLFDDFDYEQEDELAPNDSSIRTLVAVLAIVGVIISFLFMYEGPKKIPKLTSMNSNQKLQLVRTSQKPFDGDQLYRLEVSPKGRVLWVATNVNKKGQIYLTLKSIKGKVLADEEIVISSKAKIYNGLAMFSQLDIVKGSKFAPGYYQFFIDGAPYDFSDKFLDHFRFGKSKRLLGFGPASIDQFKGEGMLSFFRDSPEEFDKKLKKYADLKLKKVQAPIVDQLQKVKTLESLLAQIEDLYLGRLKVAITYRAFNKYLDGYSKNIAPILQNIILDSNATYLKKLDHEYLLSAAYLEIVDIGKMIAGLASDLHDQSSKIKKYRAKHKTYFKKMLADEKAKIMEKVEAKLKSLNQQLSSTK